MLLHWDHICATTSATAVEREHIEEDAVQHADGEDDVVLVAEEQGGDEKKPEETRE